MQESSEHIDQQVSRNIGQLEVTFVDIGKPMEIREMNGKKVLVVNRKKFPSHEEALRKGLSEAAYLDALRTEFAKQEGEEERNQKFTLLKDKKSITTQVLRLRGLKSLQLWDEGVAREIGGITPSHLSAHAQFDFACEQYILTGKVHDGLLAKVQKAFSDLLSRKNRDGLNPLDVITQELRTLMSGVQHYEKYVLPVRHEMSKIDRELKKTEREEYVPPQFQGELEPLLPEDIKYTVSPPVYGYYRGRVFRYDKTLKRIVAEVTGKKVWDPESRPENTDELTRHIFEGIFEPGKENVLPMPYKAFPLPETIQPADAFSLMRDRNGSFSLEPKKEMGTETAFKFTFLMCPTDENAIRDEPLPNDTEKFPGPFDELSQQVFEQIRKDQFLSELDRSRSVNAFVRKRFVYPEEDQVAEMDGRYIPAGDQLLLEMGDHGIANCHWANIFACQLHRELGIPSRVPTGFFVKKDPRFEFAAVGGIGHAWSEVWDRTTEPENPKWKLMDATPNKKDQEDKDKDELVDSSDVQAEDAQAEELSDEIIAEILKELPQVEARQREVADAVFTARTGVDAKKWKKVKAYIDAVNTVEVPKEDQIPETSEMQRMFGDRIRAPKGTLQREFEKLFALICEHRQISRRTFRGPVPKSEGVRLQNPAIAAVDILSSSNDPGGYEIKAIKTKTVIDIKAFEEDVLVDLTASMEDRDSVGHIMKVEQKKLILGMLYQLMRLNKLLNDSRTMSSLRTPVQINSEIFGVRGTGDRKGIWSILKTSKETITEQLLTQLADELDKTSAGQGDALSALKAYRASITPAMEQRLKSGELVKILTIYSDGMVYCLACGKENHDYQVDTEILKLIRDEVQALRDMGVVVQGLGFTKKSEAIKAICEDPKDPDSAVTVDDCSKAVLARQRGLIKHLKKL